MRGGGVDERIDDRLEQTLANPFRCIDPAEQHGIHHGRDTDHDEQAAIAAHHTGTAQQALEMAETRLLDRSTPVGSANQPDDNQRVEAVASARKALASGDTKAASAGR